MDYYQYDTKFRTREISEKMPYLKLDEGWDIKILPPFAGASSRFWIKFLNAEVSIYADFFDNCGYVGSPYWEVYPYANDVFRCAINNTEELLKAIRQSIKEQNEQFAN
jgi:hypothetical protein